MKRSGISSSSDGDDENSEMRLRSCVRRFLNLRMNKDICKTIDLGDSQKKTVSFAMNQNRNKELNVSSVHHLSNITCITISFVFK